MPERFITLLTDILHWAKSNDMTLLLLGLVSLLTFVGTLILVPVLVVRLPEDYFSRTSRRRKPWISIHTPLQLALILGKNALGLVLLAAGLFMLVLPGQGILTILIGLTLLNFPGKFRFERWLVTRRPVLRSINWLRRRANRPPLLFEGRTDPLPD